MQKAKKPAKEVVKPIMTGSWHGKDARKQGYKLMLNVLFVSVIYVILSLLLTFDSLALRIITGLILVATAGAFLYASGAQAGQTDAAFGEIMYTREQEGKPIPKADHDRCFHPAKGYYAVLIGAAPFMLVALVFACMTSITSYSLGVLPTWITRYTRQSGIGDALAYYNVNHGVQLVTILRVIVRSMTMPFINVSIKLGSVATLWAERLTPLWVVVAPLGYAIGYGQGVKMRTKINTGIAIGEKKKRRRSRRERRARANSRTPQKLI
ncbi:MAG: hypothetical protein PHO41_11840 [Eubacteriales bacterium]|nr:hypothetical protein [Eubacteriales bacterium]